MKTADFHICFVGDSFVVAAGEGVSFLSIVESLIENSVWMAEVAADDGAHPRAAGYAELAARVDRWLEWWFK